MEELECRTNPVYVKERNLDTVVLLFSMHVDTVMSSSVTIKKTCMGRLKEHACIRDTFRKMEKRNLV